jgi:hypothetical protein
MAMASSFPYAHSARPMEYTFTRQAGHNLGVLSFDKGGGREQPELISAREPTSHRMNHDPADSAASKASDVKTSLMGSTGGHQPPPPSRDGPAASQSASLRMKAREHQRPREQAIKHQHLLRSGYAHTHARLLSNMQCKEECDDESWRWFK